MFNVDNSIDDFLQNQKYQELQELLEKKVELEPNNLISYIYLGLVYFLLNQKEEAQATWFLILMAEDEFASTKLIKILDQEAHRQWKFNNYQLSYNLREIIKDNNPYLVNNLLLMAELAINLKIINNDYLVNLSLVEAIKNTHKKDIDTDILSSVFAQILDFPFLINIDLAAAILENQNGDKKLLQIISDKAYKVGLENNYLYYGAELTKICLEYQPDNLPLIKQIYKCYDGAEDFHKLEKTALSFIKYSTNDLEKLYGVYLLMRGTIQAGKWNNYSKIYQDYFSLLSQLNSYENNNKNEIFDGYIEYMLVSICHFLFYFNDSPQINRKVINQVSNLYQKLTKKRYGELLANSPPVTKNISKQKKLKIGLVSEALRVNCVGILSRWLIEYMDRDKYDIYVYKVKGREDFFTNEWFKNKVTQYYCFDEIKDTYEQIKKDEIDILMELDCFTNSFTNALMTLKPAPIQVSWLGLDSTGIPAIDYFVVDSYVLPDNAQTYYQEKIWRLPHTYIAVDGFEVNTPSLTRESLGISDSAIIYLSLQTGFKRHPDYIRLQMKILQQVADGYFLVSGYRNEWSMSNIKNLFTEIAQQEGGNPDRIKFLPYMPLQDYRANLLIGDVVLDTYPFNGATTTLDALWLNIPLVTRVGQQFHARQGYTFLQNLGITEGIAYTDEEYIQWGVKFGTDEELRKKVYWKLKESKKTSPLWNGKQFAREMEKAYQQMWEIYLQENQ